MIPRLQARGTSFKGSCEYVLHDKQAKTTDRVAWTMSQNLNADHEDAWFEMLQTWKNQDALKRNAGLSARGRKNTAPVLHYTLAWHADDQPTADEMKRAALDSLKVLGLAEHEAMIVGHSDKKHPHVHIVANTVHPYTGRTAALKFSKERLSEWAEQYEKDRGQIRCEERVKNNEQRRDIRELRKEEQVAQRFAEAVKEPGPFSKPFMIVKDLSPNRPQWLDKQEVIGRMKQMRTRLDLQHRFERGDTMQQHRVESASLDKSTQAAIDHIRVHVHARFKPQWRVQYRDQARELKTIAETATHPFERAVFVFRNRNRLGNGSRLSMRKMVGLIVSGSKLTRAVQATHKREREMFARVEKAEVNKGIRRIEDAFVERVHTMRHRHSDEIEAERGHQKLAVKEITFARAKTELIQESGNEAVAATMGDMSRPKNAFNYFGWETAEPQTQTISRADQIRLDMAEWRRRNPDKDLGREL